MRKALFSLTILAGLSAAGIASAQPVWVEAPPPGYGYAPPGYGYAEAGYDWRAREWRHREWERHRRWEEWHRYHDERGHGGW